MFPHESSGFKIRKRILSSDSGSVGLELAEDVESSDETDEADIHNEDDGGADLEARGVVGLEKTSAEGHWSLRRKSLPGASAACQRWEGLIRMQPSQWGADESWRMWMIGIERSREALVKLVHCGELDNS
ncbi:unnamed protein product [Ilex paraguariensis]|uniref:Uncharacterized protein n=1 Tax=Ilex paraguariensis TaxID=185542 RepID=A0ABC8TY23_9AQUA